MKEHRRITEKENTDSSALAKHTWKLDHRVNWEEVEVLDVNTEWYRRCMVESWHTKLLMSRFATNCSVPLAKFHDMWPKTQLLYHANPCNQVLPTTSLVYMSHGSTWDIHGTVDGKPEHHSTKHEKETMNRDEAVA